VDECKPLAGGGLGDGDEKHEDVDVVQWVGWLSQAVSTVLPGRACRMLLATSSNAL